MPAEATLLILLTVICISGYLFTSRRIGDAFFIYYLIFSIVYIFRPTVIFLGLDTLFPEDFLSSHAYNMQWLALQAILLWSISFMIASMSPVGIIPSFFFPHKQTNPNVRAYGLMLAPLFFASTIIFIIIFFVHGFDMAIITRSIRIEGFLSGFTFLQFVPITASYLSMTLVFSIIISGEYRQHKRTVMVCTIFAILFAVGSLLFGGRAIFVYFMVYVIMSYNIYVKKLSLVSLLLLGSMVVFFMFFLKDIRNELWNSNLGQENYNIFRTIADSANLDSYDKFLLLLQAQPETKWGVGFIDNLMAIIPRSVWPDKPDTLYTNFEFHNLFEYSKVGWPIKPIGEWYWNFELMGMTIGGVISGLIFRSIYNEYIGYKSNPTSYLFMYMLSVEVFQVGYVGYSPIVYINRIIPLLLFFWAVNFISRSRSKKVYA